MILISSNERTGLMDTMLTLPVTIIASTAVRRETL